MVLQQLMYLLALNKDASIFIKTPSGNIPSHFHVTEFGKIQKDFIDCGGTLRKELYATFQVWVADDVHHRLTAEKLLKIFNYTCAFEADKCPIEIEYGEEIISKYLLTKVEVTSDDLTLILDGKQTTCLAPDKCGVSLVQIGNLF